MDRSVLCEGVALVPLGAEQRATPEGGELRKVLAPVDPSDVVEHGPEQRILCHRSVEPADDLLDVTRRRDVGAHHSILGYF
jgi:hypothetical protein